MFDRYLRVLKDQLLMPLARALGPRLPPDAVTWLAFAVGMASALAILAGWWDVSLGLWLVNRVLDGLDGTLARAHARETDFGAYLDIVLDFVVYAAIPVALVAAAPTDSLALAALLLLGSFYVNAASWMYLAAILEKRSAGAAARGELTSVTMPPGIIGGTETVVFYVAFLLLPTYTTVLFQRDGGSRAGDRRAAAVVGPTNPGDVSGPAPRSRKARGRCWRHRLQVLSQIVMSTTGRGVSVWSKQRHLLAAHEPPIDEVLPRPGAMPFG